MAAATGTLLTPSADRDLAQALHSLRDQGFVLLPGLFDAQDCARQRAQLDHVYLTAGAPPVRDFGFAIHPLLAHAPGLLADLAHPQLVATVTALLGGPPRLAHTGARIASEQSMPRLGWHHHYGWPVDEIPRRPTCTRLVLNIYVDGTDAAHGPLVVLPRRWQDPLGEVAAADEYRDLPGQRLVHVPPGTAVLLDTALWHAAIRGTAPGPRRHWGAHLHRHDDLRPHPEDNGPIALQRTVLGPG